MSDSGHKDPNYLVRIKALSNKVINDNCDLRHEINKVEADLWIAKKLLAEHREGEDVNLLVDTEVLLYDIAIKTQMNNKHLRAKQIPCELFKKNGGKLDKLICKCGWHRYFHSKFIIYTLTSAS